MPLDGPQIHQLAELIVREWDRTKLTEFAMDYFEYSLGNNAPDGELQHRAQTFILDLKKHRPPRDTELLQQLSKVDNQALRNRAVELLRPDYFSPDGLPLGAIVLGRYPFVDRGDLRSALGEFAVPTQNSTHVLVVRGDGPCGKSYSWWFLHHLARNVAGVRPLHLGLARTSYSPRQFVEQVFVLLGLPTCKMPPMVDDPQQSHIAPLVNAFVGQFSTLQEPCWLVIDDLNDSCASAAVRETAVALAAAVERHKPSQLWLVLLGYNQQITDNMLQFMAQEDAHFPDVKGLARHFDHMSAVGPQPLTSGRALEIAQVFLARFPQLTKEAMITFTREVGILGEKLRIGEQP